jgi:hypothetical protein
MAAIINVAGATPISVDTGGSHALEVLGLTRDGGMVTFEPYMLDIHTDGEGGENGAPADVQFLGEVAKIHLEFTKWDEAVADKIRPRAYGGTAGTVPTLGQLMIGGSLTYRLLLFSTTRPYNFPIVMFRDPHEINKGTKYSTWTIDATAYRNQTTGVLYNATTS